MEISVIISPESLDDSDRPPETIAGGQGGAVVTFRGMVRAAEQGHPIQALDYQAYLPMAQKEIRRLAEDLGRQFPCLAVSVRHRIGLIPVGDTAVVVQVVTTHRAEAFGFVSAFMDRLKADVPIWKVRAVPAR
jgi:molybdopterin synthase catalytic subunit